MSDDEILVSAVEMVELIRQCGPVEFAFGPGWASLLHPSEQALEVLAELRKAGENPTSRTRHQTRKEG